MKNNPTLLYLQEMVIRLGKKSPVFFQILQIISTLVVLIPGIPLTLEFFGIGLGPALQIVANKTIAICGMVALFFSSLPVDTDVPKVGVETPPTYIPQTAEESLVELPFTDSLK